MKVSAAIKLAAKDLQSAGIPESRREAKSLLAFVLKRPTTFLIAHPEYDLSDAENIDIRKVIKRRVSREPFQYITGTKEFYGLDFDVTPGVLIPRPETEGLVEAAISLVGGVAQPQILEIGVGSGCISVSILMNVGNALVLGTDISKNALTLARQNAVKHGIAERLTLQQADIFTGLEGAFDLIVSNPPYIPDTDLKTLQPEVSGFEPHIALFGGPDGLDIVRRMIDGSPDLLKPGGSTLIEIGFGQAESVKRMFNAVVWGKVDFLADLQGIPRIVNARRRD